MSKVCGKGMCQGYAKGLDKGTNAKGMGTPRVATLKHLRCAKVCAKVCQGYAKGMARAKLSAQVFLLPGTVRAAAMFRMLCILLVSMMMFSSGQLPCFECCAFSWSR
jgi:hypothetical protein